MCTVSYIPLENHDYLLTHNRDEKIARGAVATLPHIIEKGVKELIAPIDQKALGTWIYTDNNKRTVCLLNGAFQKHQVKDRYSRSRGAIVFELNQYDKALEFFERVNLIGVEPFTLIAIEGSLDQLELVEMRWDEREKHISILDATQPNLWSSATLYSSTIHQNRTEFFETWLKDHFEEEKTPILSFHQIGRNEKTPTPIWLHSNLVNTVSTSLIAKVKGKTSFIYLDYVNEQEKALEF